MKQMTRGLSPLLPGRGNGAKHSFARRRFCLASVSLRNTSLNISSKKHVEGVQRNGKGGWKPRALRKFSKKFENSLKLAVFSRIGKIYTSYRQRERRKKYMLKLVGALTIILIILGMLTGVINPLGLWYIVRDVVIAVIEQLRLLFPGIAA